MREKPHLSKIPTFKLYNGDLATTWWRCEWRTGATTHSSSGRDMFGAYEWVIHDKLPHWARKAVDTF